MIVGRPFHAPIPVVLPDQPMSEPERLLRAWAHVSNHEIRAMLADRKSWRDPLTREVRQRVLLLRAERGAT